MTSAATLTFIPVKDLHITIPSSTSDPPVAITLESLFSTTPLLLPTCTLANVPQLACDLLCCSYEYQKIGAFECHYIEPFVGCDALAIQPQIATKPSSTTLKSSTLTDQSRCHGSLTLGLELFYCKSLQVLILQQRAPFFHGFNRKHAENIAEWSKSVHIPYLIVLASEFSHVRNDELLQYDYPNLQEDNASAVSHQPQPHPGIHVAIDNQWAQGVKVSDSLKWKRHFPPAPAPTPANPPVQSTEEDYDLPVSKISWLPGGAAAKYLLPSFNASSIPNATVWLYTAEGDNIQDSLLLASNLVKFIKRIQVNSINQENSSHEEREMPKWQIPLSWASMFGPPPEPDIYLH